MTVQKNDLQKIGSNLLHMATGVAIGTELLGLGVLFYLATFVRYVADDLCEIIQLRRGPLFTVIVDAYLSGTHRSANRFSKLFFVHLSGLLGTHDVQLLPIIMVILWLLGLIWIIRETKTMFGLAYPLTVDLFMAVSLVFFSIVQAPNLFQIFFWRSSSLTHFGPVVLFLLLDGFIFHRIRAANGRFPAAWVSLAVFLASFVIGGAGETPAVLMLAIYALLVLYFWQSTGSVRRPGLILMTSALAGTLLAVCAMFLAPANFSHGKTALLILPVTLMEALKFSFDFIWDTLLTLPASTLVSFVLPGLLFFGFHTKSDQGVLLPARKRHLGIALLLLPLLGYLLIAVAFAPSAYGQSFPVERARFSGRSVMTAVMVFEGAMLGVWMAQLKYAVSYRHLLYPIAGVCMLLFGLYPLRGSLWLLEKADSYRAWSSAWDARNEYIQHEVAEGTTDLIVAPMDSIANIGELKLDPKAWINRCAAEYYGLDSIRIE